MHDYKFSVSHKSLLKTITIEDGGWMSDLWKRDEDKLVSMFNQHKFYIDYHEHKLFITTDAKIPYFHAINKFDDMINGKKSIGWTKSQRSVISDLMDYKIDEKQTPNIDKSIIDSFATFTKNKLKITLDYEYLEKYSDSEMVNKLMHGMQKNKNVDIDYYSDSESRNSFRGDIIFKLFNNLQSIVINGCSDYKFSLRYLLAMMIKSYSLQTITIYDYQTWIYKVWNSDKDKLISMFNQHQFDIKYIDKYPRRLIINRQ